MGYHTYFDGAFMLDEPLSKEQVLYLSEFAGTRRMKRDVERYENSSRSKNYETVNLPIGEEGCYVADRAGFTYGEHNTLCLLEKWEGQAYSGIHPNVLRDAYNTPPKGQPGLWCQWAPNEEGTEIAWDGSEKFYDYEEWIKYIIEHFLKPWGKSITGEITFSGEEPTDRGILFVSDNEVQKVYDEITNPGPAWSKTEHEQSLHG